MNNFKWQYLVGECKIDFPIATRTPSFGNSSWIYLSDSIITVDAKYRQPTQVIFSHCCSRGADWAEKDLSHAQEPTDYIRSSFKSHEHLGTSQGQHKRLNL